jgi:hypothetical protein
MHESPLCRIQGQYGRDNQEVTCDRLEQMGIRFRTARFVQDGTVPRCFGPIVKGDYQSVFDISKAYHHLRLHPSSYELVGFCVQDVDGKERFYHYVVVVFDLGPAGQALGRVMRPIMIYLAKCGIRNMMYVDDGRVGASTKQRADTDYARTLEVFEKAGFTVNKEKLDKLGDSAQRKEYLGFCIDTKEMAVHVPELKLARVLGILDAFMRRRRHRVRETDLIGARVGAVSISRNSTGHDPNCCGNRSFGRVSTA